jgi:hypothetical protein
VILSHLLMYSGPRPSCVNRPRLSDVFQMNRSEAELQEQEVSITRTLETTRASLVIDLGAGSHSVAQAGLKLMILLPHSAFPVLGL